VKQIVVIWARFDIILFISVVLVVVDEYSCVFDV